MKQFETQQNQFEKWEKLLFENREIELVDLLMEAPVVDVSEFLCKQTSNIILRLLSLFKGESRSEIFTNFDEPIQLQVYEAIPKQAVADIFLHMASDQRADFYQKLSNKEQIKLLPYLKKRVRQDVITLSSYPKETAGGIMSTDFATVSIDMTINEALDKLREDAPSKKMMYYIYVLNENFQMIGIVSLKDLVMATQEEKIENILFENFVFGNVGEDRESVAKKIEKYDLAAIPILNEDNQLVGIVSYDEAIDVIRAEQTEDMEKFMGIVSTSQEIEYLQTSSIQHFKRRISWVIGLFILSFISGAIIDSYQSVLTKFTILATYITSITDAGGNAGSQAASVVIRAIALGQISLKNWFTIIFKEAKVAILLSCCLFFLAFIKVISLTFIKSFVYSEKVDTQHHSIYKIALTISIALSLQVIVSTVIGAILPLIAKLFKGDPAVAASPAITTIVDITGMLIYFTIAAKVLC